MTVGRRAATEQAKLLRSYVNQAMRGSGKDTNTVSRRQEILSTLKNHTGVTSSNMINLFRFFMPMQKG